MEVDKFIIECVPLVMGIARRFSNRFPHKTYDVRSVALLGLVQAVRYLEENGASIPESKPYIKRFVSGCLWRFVKEDQAIRIPHMAYKKGIRPVEIETWTNAVGADDFDLEIVDVKDTIAALNLTERESDVLRLRLQNYTQKEIGDKLQISQQGVSIALSTIRTKYVTKRPSGESYNW